MSATPSQAAASSRGERDFLEWAARGFEVVRRAWIGAYLAFELRKVSAPEARERRPEAAVLGSEPA